MLARLLIVTCAALTGCALTPENYSSLYDGYSTPPVDKTAIDKYRLLLTSLSEGEDPIIQKSCLSGEIPPTDKQKCKTQRNGAISALANASVEICTTHRRSIYGREAGSNIVLGSLTNLFSGAAAVASGQQMKSVYAALALFTNSERSLVNETVYKQMLVTAVDQKIIESMESKAGSIKARLGEDIDSYGAHIAISDVIDMHHSCSFMNGVRLALLEGTKSNTIDSRISSLKTQLNSMEPELQANCKDSVSLPCQESRRRYKNLSDRIGQLETIKN